MSTEFYTPKPTATGVIVYREHGIRKEWRVGCHAKLDSAATLREHLKAWKPDAEFVSADVVCDDIGDK